MNGYYRGAIMIPHTPKYPGRGTGFYDPKVDYSAGNWPLFITSAAQCVELDPEGCLRYVNILADIADSIIERNAMGL